jgi:hypothetical protein
VTDPLAAEARRPRPGVVPTAVRPASIARLAWSAATADGTEEPRPGRIDPCPVARWESTTLHVATALDGAPAFVLRGPSRALAARHQELVTVGSIDGTGVVAPSPLQALGRELWLDRRAWLAPRSRPDTSAVTAYVAGAVRTALVTGTIVGTGRPDALADGRIGSVDVVVARQLECDERHTLGALWLGLVLLDPVMLADAATAMCRACPPNLPAAAQRSVVSLGAEWTAVSLGLSLHHVACAMAGVGPRAEPLVLLADELLHRLDLAHEHRVPVEPLSGPTQARRLLEPEASCA